MGLKYKNIEIYFLLIAVFLYSFSFPFPKSITIVEILILVSLIFFIGSSLKYLFHYKNIVQVLLFISFLIFPLVVAMIEGNSLANIIRDIIPYFYFSLTLIFFLKKRKKEYIDKLLIYLPWLLSLSGIIFAFRELYIWSQMGNIFVVSQFQTEDYLGQSPIVLFSATFLFLKSFYFFKYKKYFYMLLSFIFFIFPFSVFFFMVLRAPLLLVIFMGLLYLLLLYKKNKFILLFVLLIVLGFFFFTMDYIIILLELFIKNKKYMETTLNLLR